MLWFQLQNSANMKLASIKVLYTLSIIVLVHCVVYLYYFSSISNEDSEYEITRNQVSVKEDAVGRVPLLFHTSKEMNKVTPSQSASNVNQNLTRPIIKTRLEYNEVGYVMGTSYYDQLTGSLANMMSLQCWASSMGANMRVVEPTLLESVLSINLQGIIYDNDTSATFNDFFNRSKWNKMSETRHIAQLVTWDNFIENAPRKLILVDKPNEKLSKIFNEHGALLEKKYGFEVVRKRSLPPKTLNPSEFKELVYGNYDPHEAVVIFRAWGGIQSGEFRNRVAVSGTKCGRQVTGFTPISSKIIEDGIKYMNKYIKNGATKGYISVMIRMEHYLKSHNFFKGKAENEALNTTMKCLNTLVREVNALKAKYDIDSIFLTMDCRDSGSYMFKIAFPEHITQMANNAMVNLFPMLYGNSTTLEEWDKSFEDTASFPKVSGYIALLQKHLAAKATCLLTVGGGSFQSTAQQLHSTYHPNSPKCSHHFSGC